MNTRWQTVRRRLSPARLIENIRSRRGSALLAAMISIIVVSGTLAVVSRSIQSNATIMDRKRASVKALQAAEAGIAAALDLFHRPERFDPDTTFGVNPFVANPDDVSDYDPLTTLLAGGDLVIDELLYPPIIEEDGTAIADVIDIRLTQPPAGTDPEAIGMLVSTARSRRYGIIQTVEAVVRPPRSFLMVAPAALVSFKGAYLNGNFMVHWGEAWSKGPMGMAHPNRYNDYSDGPAVAIRSESNIVGVTGGQWRVPAEVESSPTIENVWEHSTSATIQSDFANRLFQNQTLEFPEYDYETIKAVARQFGHYYSTDAEGNIYRNGIETPENIVSIDTIMNNDPNDPAKFVMIDTIDGNPPDFENRTNLANIDASGSGEGTRYMRGLYYFGASLDIRGIGSSAPPLSVEIPDEPDGWPSSVNWPTGDKVINAISDGVCVVAGDLRCTGQPPFYGSLVAFGEIVGGGTPNIYYNPKLRDGLDFPLLSRVEAFQWRNVRGPDSVYDPSVLSGF